MPQLKPFKDNSFIEKLIHDTVDRLGPNSQEECDAFTQKISSAIFTAIGWTAYQITRTLDEEKSK